MSHKPSTLMSFQTCCQDLPPESQEVLCEAWQTAGNHLRQRYTKTFKAAAKKIRNVILHPDVQRYFKLSFEWHFNLEKAPWWGAMFERMIRSTKRCLRKLVRQAHFTHDELLTAVVEIEAVLNAHPLSCISPDTEEPMTPSHLLCGYRLLSLPKQLSYSRPLDNEDFEIT